MLERTGCFAQSPVLASEIVRIKPSSATVEPQLVSLRSLKEKCPFSCWPRARTCGHDIYHIIEFLVCRPEASCWAFASLNQPTCAAGQAHSGPLASHTLHLLLHVGTLTTWASGQIWPTVNYGHLCSVMWLNDAALRMNYKMEWKQEIWKFKGRKKFSLVTDLPILSSWWFYLSHLPTYDDEGVDDDGDDQDGRENSIP